MMLFVQLPIKLLVNIIYRVAGECHAKMAKCIREGYSAWVFAKIFDRGKEKWSENNFDPGGGNKMLLEKVKEVIGDSYFVIFTFCTRIRHSTTSSVD